MTDTQVTQDAAPTAEPPPEYVTRAHFAGVMVRLAEDFEAERRRLTELEQRVAVMAELLPGTPPAAAAPNRHVMDAAIALADAAAETVFGARETGIVDWYGLTTAETAFRAALADTEREPVQDCGCDELWRLASDFVLTLPATRLWTAKEVALAKYIREHGNG